jgi:hypothetical protein
LVSNIDCFLVGIFFTMLAQAWPRCQRAEVKSIYSSRQSTA